jgi:integrase
MPNLMRPYLRELIEGKQPLDPVFGYHDRGCVREWVQRICKVAGVPIVSAHGMRGLHSTLAVDAGITSHAVASALGHESFSTTSQSYARPEALDRARQARVLGALRPPKTKKASRELSNPAKPLRLSVELNGIEPSAS